MDRFVCTIHTPWTEDKGRAIHPDAYRIEGHYDNSALHEDYEVYECPYCNMIFKETLSN